MLEKYGVFMDAGFLRIKDRLSLQTSKFEQRTIRRTNQAMGEGVSAALNFILTLGFCLLSVLVVT